MCGMKTSKILRIVDKKNATRHKKLKIGKIMYITQVYKLINKKLPTSIYIEIFCITYTTFYEYLSGNKKENRFSVASAFSVLGGGLVGIRKLFTIAIQAFLSYADDERNDLIIEQVHVFILLGRKPCKVDKWSSSSYMI